MIKLSTPQEYFKFIKACPISLIHFGTEWNGSDYSMKIKFKEIESSYTGKVCFGAVDVDLTEMFEICRNVKIVNVPAISYYKVCEHLETVIGLNQQIEERLNLLLSGSNLKNAVS